MKVTAITPLNQDTENPSWRVNLEGDNKPLWIFKNKPQFVAGYDIPDDKVKLSSKGTSYIWNYGSSQAPKQEQHRDYPPKQEKGGYNTDATGRNCSLIQATEIYKHCVEPITPFDKEQFGGIYNYLCKLLGIDIPLVEAIKKEGGVVRTEPESPEREYPSSSIEDNTR